MIVGLTGGIASGKSTVQDMFSELGIPTISADAIAKDLLENEPRLYAAVINKFNAERITKDNKLDRKKLREKIFNSESDRLWLEKLLHPLIKERIKNFADSCKSPYCVIEIPLLYEANWLDCVDNVLIVDTTEELQMQRASLRDNLPDAQIQKIMGIQLTRDERLQKDAEVIKNVADLAALKQQVLKLHQNYLELSAAM